METSNKKQIIENTELLKLYLNKTEDGDRTTYFDLENSDDIDDIFYLFSNSLYEDPYVFYRILLYIANNRNNPSQELFYKSLLHFVATLAPQFILSNIDILLKFGYKNDILYLLLSQNIQSRVIKYVDHLAKNDNDFKTLKSGNLLKKTKSVKVSYNEADVVKLLTKILDDPIFNGISI